MLGDRNAQAPAALVPEHAPHINAAEVSLIAGTEMFDGTDWR